MRQLNLILGIVSIASLFAWLFAIVVWAVAIQRYIVEHRELPSSYSPFILAALVGSVQDYRHARRIAAKRGYVPWFLQAFQGLAWVGLAGFVIVLAASEWLKGGLGVVDFIRDMVDRIRGLFA